MFRHQLKKHQYSLSTEQHHLLQIWNRMPMHGRVPINWIRHRPTINVSSNSNSETNNKNENITEEGPVIYYWDQYEVRMIKQTILYIFIFLSFIIY